MSKNAIERLQEKMLRKDSRIVVELNPSPKIIPSPYSCEENLNDRMIWFCKDYIRAISGLVSAISIDPVLFEAANEENSFFELAQFAKDHDLFVIADLKKCNMGHIAEAYANKYLDIFSPIDAITVNPYLGTDGIQPFIKKANQSSKAVFIMIKTSNKSSSEIQELKLEDGRLLYEAIADKVYEWTNYTAIDKYGYKGVGAIVGINDSKQAVSLRKRIPKTLLLISYDTQKTTIEDIAVNFDCNGLGCIISYSSEELIGAHKEYKYNKYSEMEWANATKEKLEKCVKEINNAITKKE